jgi:thiamine pyrophosphate-dependent acetolactate synthase large subunit-like protein
MTMSDRSETQARPGGPGNAQVNAHVMNRSALTRRLVARLPDDAAVIGGIGNSNFDLWAAGRRAQNFYMLGSMGLACPIALGVAIAQPQRRVVAIEGDGSLLMQLGALTTTAMRAPKNLTIVVMDNGIYQITGAQPTATAFGADLVAIARGAGLARSEWAADEAMFDDLVDRALGNDGPWLIAALIDAEPAAATTEREPVLICDRFMRGLGVKT